MKRRGVKNWLNGDAAVWSDVRIVWISKENGRERCCWGSIPLVLVVSCVRVKERTEGSERQQGRAKRRQEKKRGMSGEEKRTCFPPRLASNSSFPPFIPSLFTYSADYLQHEKKNSHEFYHDVHCTSTVSCIYRENSSRCRHLVFSNGRTDYYIILCPNMIWYQLYSWYFFLIKSTTCPDRVSCLIMCCYNLSDTLSTIVLIILLKIRTKYHHYVSQLFIYKWVSSLMWCLVVMNGDDVVEKNSGVHRLMGWLFDPDSQLCPVFPHHDPISSDVQQIHASESEAQLRKLQVSWLHWLWCWLWRWLEAVSYAWNIRGPCFRLDMR